MGAALAGCAADVGTTPYAHESPGDAPEGLDDLRAIRGDRFLGGSGRDLIEDLDVTGDGDLLLAGGTSSTDFPTTDGSTLDTTAQTGCSACPHDATITKLSADGTSVRWSRVLGGPGFDRATTIVFDSGLTFVAGSTGGGLPTTTGAGDRTFAGGSTPERGDEDGFVCRLDTATGAVDWCTYVGGAGPGGVTAIAFRGNVYVAFAVAAGADLHLDADYAAAFAGGHRATQQGADIVILSLAPQDGAFVSATFAGGTGDEFGPASLVEDGSYFHVLAGTSSTDVPVPNGLLTTAPPGTNLFFATYAPGLTGLAYGTYLGGDGDEETTGNGLDGWTDGTQIVAVGGTTTSNDMPYRNGIHGRPVASGALGCGRGDVWFAVLQPDQAGSASLLYASYLGGGEGERFGGLHAIDSAFGRVVALTGSTSSTTFPVNRGARTQWLGPTCSTLDGATEGFVAHVNTTVSRHAATFVGGSSYDRGTALLQRHVVGETSSADLPTVTGGDDELGGTRDGFLIELGAPPPPPPGGGDGGPTDASEGFEHLPGDHVFPPDDDDGGCCGTAPVPVAPGTATLAGLVMLLVRRRRGR